MARLLLQLTHDCDITLPQRFWLMRSYLKVLLDVLEGDKTSRRTIGNIFNTKVYHWA